MSGEIERGLAEHARLPSLLPRVETDAQRRQMHVCMTITPKVTVTRHRHQGASADKRPYMLALELPS